MRKLIQQIVPALILLAACNAAQGQNGNIAPVQPAPGRPAGPSVGVTIIPQTSNGLPIGVPETSGGIFGEPLQRFDSQYPWMHGYIQEIPPYAGYGAFRPYNYKHVLSQAQTAGGWGESPALPYAQQFWHRYRKRASMLPDPEAVSRSTPAWNRPRTSYRVRRKQSRSRSNNGPVITPASGKRFSRRR